MRDADTSLESGPGRFPETTHGFLGELGRHGSPEAAAELLGRRYWRPVYVWLRAAWRKSNEDAKDLTQAFFLWVLEEDLLGQYARSGSFRGYLKVLLKRFVGHHERALQRLKRGGGRAFVPLDAEAAPAGGPTADPEALFDRAWWTDLVNGAVDRIRERHAAPDAALAFRVYEAYDLPAEPERPTYADLGRRLGLSEADVKRHLFAVRGEVQDEIRRELARLTTDERSLREEWKALFGA